MSYYKQNPFLAELRGYHTEKEVRANKKRVIQVGEDPGELATDENGKIIEVVTPGDIIRVDADPQQYVKLYATARKLIGLKKSAIDVFLYIATHLKYKQDKIEINTSDVCSFIGYKSRQSLYTALKELQAAGVLARTFNSDRGSMCFWINPTYIYNGPRNSLFTKSKEVISSEEEYEQVAAEIDSLLKGRSLSDLSEEEHELLDALSGKITEYDERVNNTR